MASAGPSCGTVKGIMKGDFELYLKECEFRFNMRGRDIYKFLLKEFRERPLN